MKRLVLFVEGQGESEAAPKLVKRLLTEQDSWDDLILDSNPFRVGEINGLLKGNCEKWKRLLANALRRRNVEGVLLLLDGDVDKTAAGKFCAANIARLLAAQSKQVGGGASFSVAIVFARQEFESWLIAGIASLAGQHLSDGRKIPAVTPPNVDLEESPRDAKGWLSSVVNGYRPTRDQALLTELVDLTEIRARNMRSFRRLEAALQQLVLAMRTGQHVASPS